MKNKIQITLTASKALNIQPNKDKEYWIDKSTIITAQELSKVCAYYESLITEKLIELKENLQ